MGPLVDRDGSCQEPSDPNLGPKAHKVGSFWDAADALYGIRNARGELAMVSARPPKVGEPDDQERAASASSAPEQDRAEPPSAGEGSGQVAGGRDSWLKLAEHFHYEREFGELAKRLLRSEMTKRGYSYRELAALLSEAGVPETEANLKKKITRGTFSAAYFLRCLRSMGVKSLELEVPKPQVRFELGEGNKLIMRRVEPES